MGKIEEGIKDEVTRQVADAVPWTVRREVDKRLGLARDPWGTPGANGLTRDQCRRIAEQIEKDLFNIVFQGGDRVFAVAPDHYGLGPNDYYQAHRRVRVSL